ncbi:hypothetical protein O7606_07475 [Micromonospora sp. WMMD882]|uniref:hypothetical protein n=1 Tax=Micromonospora sp. WMMD882 TaxID=3015151 RepID=UPI00248D3293|nr:hypothetical protein [Micromonospora sp. WMMD882]WBB81208.1 hypothetical protein O7606_07475 [Micromonospora sp. WMMD882]
MSRRTGRPSFAQPRPQPGNRRAVLLTAVLVLVAALLGGLVGWAVGRPDATERAVAELRAEETRRDGEQIRTLTEQARTTGGQLGPLLAELDAALEAGQPAPAERVSAWQRTVAEAQQRHADNPSGSTGTNVARGGFRTAVDGAAVAVDTYAAASALPADRRGVLYALVERQHKTVTVTWSMAAAQLDQLNIDAGLGHQHVHLDGGADGGFAPDHEQEGHVD